MVVGLFLARKPFSFLTPAYGAALALVAIQVGIGILYKVAQSGGKLVFLLGMTPLDVINSCQIYILGICLYYDIRVSQILTFNNFLLPRTKQESWCRRALGPTWFFTVYFPSLAPAVA